MRAPAAEYLIRQRVSALGRSLPAAKAGDVTSLHRARVATRRLRAALPLVAPEGKAEKVVKSVRRLTRVLSGARVSALSDVDLDRAKSVASGLPGDVRVHATGEDLIGDDVVDAVVVASWGPTHEEYVLASIAAGKQVFCEKPLATTREACERILDAEVAAGRRMVMVGFMRRYDAGYRAMKDTISSGEIGAPLIFHSAHRNPSVPPSVTRA